MSRRRMTPHCVCSVRCSTSIVALSTKAHLSAHARPHLQKDDDREQQSKCIRTPDALKKDSNARTFEVFLTARPKSPA
jgi:hypothetical protein